MAVISSPGSPGGPLKYSRPLSMNIVCPYARYVPRSTFTTPSADKRPASSVRTRRRPDRNASSPRSSTWKLSPKSKVTSTSSGSGRRRGAGGGARPTTTTSSARRGPCVCVSRKCACDAVSSPRASRARSLVSSVPLPSSSRRRDGLLNRRKSSARQVIVDLASGPPSASRPVAEKWPLPPATESSVMRSSWSSRVGVEPPIGQEQSMLGRGDAHAVGVQRAGDVRFAEGARDRDRGPRIAADAGVRADHAVECAQGWNLDLDAGCEDGVRPRAGGRAPGTGRAVAVIVASPSSSSIARPFSVRRSSTTSPSMRELGEAQRVGRRVPERHAAGLALDVEGPVDARRRGEPPGAAQPQRRLARVDAGELRARPRAARPRTRRPSRAGPRRTRSARCAPCRSRRRSRRRRGGTPAPRPAAERARRVSSGGGPGSRTPSPPRPSARARSRRAVPSKRRRPGRSQRSSPCGCSAVPSSSTCAVASSPSAGSTRRSPRTARLRPGSRPWA